MFSFLKRKSRTDAPVSQIAQCVAVLKALPYYVFLHIHSSDLSTFKVNVLYNRIETYRSKLEIALDGLKYRKTLFSTEFNPGSRAVPIGEFFLTVRNEYLADTGVEARALVASMIEFLTYYLEIEHLEDDENVLTHNRMVLQNTIQNIVLLSQQFEKLHQIERRK